MTNAGDVDHALRVREHEENRKLREAELEIRRDELRIKRSDSARSKWSSPLFVAVVAAAVALYGQHALREQARQTAEENDKQRAAQTLRDNKQFCYRVIADSLSRSGEDARKVGAELQAVVKALDMRAECNGDLRELADVLVSPGADSAKPTDPALGPKEITAAGSCKKIVSIRTLGWSGGHKTNFCRARKYDGINKFDGVHNPFGDYSAGGYCFAGEAAACISEIESKMK